MSKSAVNTQAMPVDDAAPSRPGFGSLLRISEFRALWLSGLLSLSGDQLARVALTVLVYDRTQSALLAAVTFATSIVPAFIGGVALSGLADRFPRRQFMIVVDVASCVLVAAMAVPGMPLAALLVLLFAVTTLGTPYIAARAGMLPDVLQGDRYVAGLAMLGSTAQVAQIVGSVAGGAAVALLGARGCLTVDAVTFAVSALLVAARVKRRPAARAARRETPPEGAESAARARRFDGLRTVLGGELRTWILLAWLGAFLAVPDGVVVPLSRSVGGGAVTAGVLLAVSAAGAVVGFTAVSKLPQQRQVRLVKPLAVASCAALALFALRLPAGGMAAVLVAVGLLACYQIPINALWVLATPPARRSQVSGIVNAGLALGQGGAMVAAGAVAEWIPVSDVVALSGALGAVLAAAVILGAVRGARPRSARAGR